MSGVKKAINLPSWNKLKFMLDEDGSVHYLSGHKKGGNRLTNSIRGGGHKDIFPDSMSEQQITTAVKEAYNNSKKINTQVRFNGDKVVTLLGESKDGLKIKMYINVTQKMLETAFTQ